MEIQKLNVEIIKTRLNSKLQPFYENVLNLFEENNIIFSDDLILIIYDLLQFSKNPSSLSFNALLIALFLTIEEGSLCLPLSQEAILDKYKIFLKQEDALSLCSETLANLKDPLFETDLISRNEEYKPLILDQSQNTPYLYFQKFYHSSKELFNHLQKRITLTKQPFSNITNLLNDLEYPLHESQVKAIQMALQNSFSIISGGPGTGKTTVIFSILRALLQNNIPLSQIALAAPTGRASGRLNESLLAGLQKLKSKNANDLILETSLTQEKWSSKTIHRLLNYSLAQNTFLYNENHLLPYSVLIVDEVSMIDLFLMQNLFKALRSDCKIIFLGDKNQLPSVEAGSILSDLTPKSQNTENNFFIELKKSFRSQKHILDLADALNNSKNTNIESISYNTFNSQNAYASNSFLIESKDSKNEWDKVLSHWQELSLHKNGSTDFLELLEAAEQKDSKELLDSPKLLQEILSYLNYTKILCLVKKGLKGSEYTNDYLALNFQKLRKVKNNLYRFSKDNFFSGLPILILENNYQKNLFNGDIGILIEDKKQNLNAYFESTGSLKSYPIEILPAFDKAYCITVHKSQGSEYDNILLPLPNNPQNPLLNKQILYTAVTRAKNSVYIYAENTIFKQAVSKTFQRHSAFNFFKTL